MKWYIISIITGIACLFPTYAHADNTAEPPDSLKDKRPAYVDRLLRYRSTWHRLIPNQFTTQFAGSIGVVSFGAGWHYGKKDNWETDLLLGVVPRFNSPNCNLTFTLKERYVPWQFDAGTSWKLAPLTTGIFLSSIFGEDFWKSEPSRYPKRYYGFSTQIRANLFVGQRATFRIPAERRQFCRSISLYYELSTCDLYLISAIQNRHIRMKDILSLAIGLRLDVF